VSLERIKPSTIYPAPASAHVIVASGSRTIYIGGQLASDLAGDVLAEGDYEKQGEIAMRNVALAVEAAGATVADLVQLNVYIVGLTPESQERALAGLGAAAIEVGLRRTTMKVLGVQALGKPGALIELDGIAVID
jgi:enamine deaminase RidA (YjgF/YER057c/UK114 family)